jgi:hypothetical protein
MNQQTITHSVAWAALKRAALVIAVIAALLTADHLIHSSFYIDGALLW